MKKKTLQFIFKKDLFVFLIFLTLFNIFFSIYSKNSHKYSFFYKKEYTLNPSPPILKYFSGEQSQVTEIFFNNYPLIQRDFYHQIKKLNKKNLFNIPSFDEKIRENILINQIFIQEFTDENIKSYHIYIDYETLNQDKDPKKYIENVINEYFNLVFDDILKTYLVGKIQNDYFIETNKNNKNILLSLLGNVEGLSLESFKNINNEINKNINNLSDELNITFNEFKEILTQLELKHFLKPSAQVDKDHGVIKNKKDYIFIIILNLMMIIAYFAYRMFKFMR